MQENMEDALPQNDSQRFLVWMTVLGMLITKEFNRALEPVGLTYKQTMLLFALARCGNTTRVMNKLSEMLQVSQANISGLVDRLERAGYIERTQKASDRRMHGVCLTAQGTEIVERLQAHWPPESMKHIDAVFTDLSDDERSILQKVFTQLSQKLHQ